MSWMEEADRARLRLELERTLRHPVGLSVSSGSGGGSTQALEVLEELAALSALLTVSRTDRSSGLHPTIEVKGRNRGRIVFIGLPMGYEFPTLVDAIRDASRGETSLDAEVRKRLADIPADRRIRVFTTPT